MKYLLNILLLDCIAFISCIQMQCNETFARKLTVDGNEIISRKEGDYIIQSLMTLTEGGDCTHVTTVGLFRVYGIKFAIEKINKRYDILPNITLGYEIYDGCLSVPLTISRGIEIVRNYRNSFCYKNDKCSNNKNNKGEGQNIAVIGAYYSYASLPLASLLSLHNIPQISYGSSSSLLSKTRLYPSFHRTIPSDKNQVDVFIEILKTMNWTYVFIVGSDDDYGKLAIADMKHVATQHDICIAGDMYIPHDTKETKSVAMEIVNKINSDKKSQVVVMFGYAKGMADELLQAAQRINMTRYWLTSEGWNPHILKVNAPPEQLKSVLTISLVKGKLPEFSDYFRDVITRDYNCDIWLNLFLTHVFNCNVTNTLNGKFMGFSPQDKSVTCELNVSMVTRYILEQNPDQVNNLIDAVYALAYSLNKIVQTVCQNSTSNCVPRIDVEELTKQLTKISFVNLQNKTIAFDQNGDIKGVEYSVENLQRNKDGAFQYRTVGTWIKNRQQRLQLNVDKVQWPNWFKNDLKSKCGRTCQPGEFVVGKRDCCWECQQCADNTAASGYNAPECIPCKVGYHTINNQICIETAILYLSPTSTVGSIIICFSAIGLFLVLLCSFGYYFKRQTNVIASNSLFVTVVAFLVVFALFLFASFFVVKPTETICEIKQAYFSLVFAAYVSLLFIQNLSIVNFIMKFTSNKNKYVKTGKICIFLILMLLQIILVIFWFLHDNNKLEKYQSEIDEILEQCSEDFSIIRIIMTAHPYIILAITTIAGIPDRKHTSNYHLARYLNYVCIASCIVAVSYLFTMRQVDGRYQAIAFSVTINAFGFVYLMCILVPRLYWALTRKEERSVKVKEAKVNDAKVKEGQIKDIYVNEGIANIAYDEKEDPRIPQMTRL